MERITRDLIVSQLRCYRFNLSGILHHVDWQIFNDFCHCHAKMYFFTLKMKAMRVLETFVTGYQLTSRNVQESLNLYCNEKQSCGSEKSSTAARSTAWW